MSFWWCLTHAEVEGSASDDQGCATLDRLGPYASQQEASSALERVRARTAEQDAKDAADDAWGEGEDRS